MKTCWEHVPLGGEGGKLTYAADERIFRRGARWVSALPHERMRKVSWSSCRDDYLMLSTRHWQRADGVQQRGTALWPERRCLRSYETRIVNNLKRFDGCSAPFSNRPCDRLYQWIAPGMRMRTHALE